MTAAGEREYGSSPLAGTGKRPWLRGGSTPIFLLTNGEDVTEPLTREVVNQPMTNEVTQKLTGDEVTKPLTGEDMTQYLTGEEETQPSTSEDDLTL